MRRLKNSLFVLLFTLPGIFAPGSSFALDYRTIDRLTYQCFQSGKWDSVVLVGHQALREDIDYYYLRVRMGVAYYNLTEYFSAVVHLEKARKFNSFDPYVTDYLCKAYQMTNRASEAALAARALPAEDRPAGVISNLLVQEIQVQAGYTLSSNASPKNLSRLMGKDSIYGEQDLYGNNLYANLGLKLKISDRLSFEFAYNYLNFNKTKYIQYGRTELHRDTIIDNPLSRDYFYSTPWVIHDTAVRYNVTQHEAYLSAPITLPWGMKLIPAVHFVYVGYPLSTVTSRVDSVSDTAYFSKPDNTWHLFRYPLRVYNVTMNDTAFSNFVASLKVSKDIGRFSIALCGSWSNLNGKTQEQAGASLTYFPLGNLSFYGLTSVTGFFQGKDTRLLLSQVLGGKIAKWMWAEANFNYGDYTNANISNGAIIFNNSDKIDYRAGATISFVPGRHLLLSLIYQYSKKESLQYFITKKENPVTHVITTFPQTTYNSYNTNSIIVGITWKL